MKNIIAFLFILATANAFGQIGVSLRYQSMNPIQWEEQSNLDLFNTGFEVGIDYWTRLKEYRMEFLSEVYWGNTRTSFEDDTYKMNVYGLGITSNIYIFDFFGDCDCPTFSKEGNFFSKGFFLSVTPGTEFQFKSAINKDISDSQLVFTGAIGAGVDIGILDLVTLTPYLRYKFIPNVKWNGFSQAHNGAEEDSGFISNYLQFGVRMGLRPDYVKSQRRFSRR